MFAATFAGASSVVSTRLNIPESVLFGRELQRVQMAGVIARSSNAPLGTAETGGALGSQPGSSRHFHIQSETVAAHHCRAEAVMDI
jgi:hypothetical protein